MFEEVARNRAIHTPSLKWLATSDDPSANWEREFYTKALTRLAEAQRRQVLRICAVADETEVEAVIYELLVHELLWRLDLAPAWHPSIGEQTPDLGFRKNTQDFISDCVVVHSPERTITKFPDGRGCAYDGPQPGDSRSHKVCEIVERKASKYRGTGLPLVVFVFPGDLHLMDRAVLERMLYGRTTVEASEGETFPSVGYAPVLTGGLLLPIEPKVTRHANLSAVVWCDWFWPPRSAPREKRLFCTVCHHWAPGTPLPAATFAPLFQIAWRPAEAGEWSPNYLGEPNMVVRFEADGRLTSGTYSNGAPW
jgi:hypothetical protein